MERLGTVGQGIDWQEWKATDGLGRPLIGMAWTNGGEQSPPPTHKGE